MNSTIKRFFEPPKNLSFERMQKAKILHVTLLVVAFTSFLLGLQNFPGGFLYIALFGLCGFSFLCMYLNKRGYYKFTAVFISVLLYIVLTYSLIVGVGVWDAGLLTFPIFIFYTAFLFNKRAAYVATFFSIVSVVLVCYLDCSGKLTPSEFIPINQTLAIITLFVAAGFLLFVVSGSWEKILGNLREAYDSTLIGWAKVLEYRDYETQGHSQRVTEMSVRLAQMLDVPESSWEHIRRGAMLHDIGKMAIPDSVLLKNTPLTEEDWEIIKKHPGRARQMLEKIPFLKPAMIIPYYHHEKWDGSGYPEGLSGEDIPFVARIFTVVDVWDALLSDRPYRKAWPEEKVRQYILDKSGILFDPKVVEAFFNLLENDPSGE